MKITKLETPEQFNPIKLEIVIESIKELQALQLRLNLSNHDLANCIVADTQDRYAIYKGDYTNPASPLKNILWDFSRKK